MKKRTAILLFAGAGLVGLALLHRQSLGQQSIRPIQYPNYPQVSEDDHDKWRFYLSFWPGGVNIRGDTGCVPRAYFFSKDWVPEWKGVRINKKTFARYRNGECMVHRQPQRQFSIGFPLWVPELLFALIFCLALRSTIRLRVMRRRTRMGHCAYCNYDLKGNASGCCPECGKDLLNQRSKDDVLDGHCKP